MAGAQENLYTQYADLLVNRIHSILLLVSRLYIYTDGL